MYKYLVFIAILILTITEANAYAIKVYDEYGNRVGTYRKEGDNYQLYDFYENKVETPESLIKDAPEQKTLTEYSRTFYDANMMPIGTWRSGFYGNDGRYYPRGVFYPSTFSRTRTPYIVRPSARNGFNKPPCRPRTYFVDTRYPRISR